MFQFSCRFAFFNFLSFKPDTENNANFDVVSRKHGNFLSLRKIIVERVTVPVVKFRVDNRGSDGTGCFRDKVRTDAEEL